MPAPLDPFGIEREAVIRKSRVREIFTPHRPVDAIELLFGRGNEVATLLQAMNTPGQHVLLYGVRGVGKSSLALSSSRLLIENRRRRSFIKRCDSQTRFEQIFQEPLHFVGVDLDLAEVTSVSRRGRMRRFGSSPFDLSYERSSELMHLFQAKGALAPSDVAQALCRVPGFLVVDEIDTVDDASVRRLLAETIKQLSDMNSEFKIMLVGVAETSADLLQGHPSVSRCLRETKLNVMTVPELKEIVRSGAEKSRIEFGIGAINAITKISVGFPHFTHLLALHCAEEAVADGSRRVDRANVRRALSSAATGAEESLRRTYDGITQAQSDMYRSLLVAGAKFEHSAFSTANLREQVEEDLAGLLNPATFGGYIRRLASDDGTRVFKRIERGWYRFSDPRMPAYIRMMNGMLD